MIQALGGGADWMAFQFYEKLEDAAKRIDVRQADFSLHHGRRFLLRSSEVRSQFNAALAEVPEPMRQRLTMPLTN